MIEVFDNNMKKVAVLQNAYDRIYEDKLNAVGTLSFKLPAIDPKIDYIHPFTFVRDDRGVYYRIIIDGIVNSDKDFTTYVAEHAIATLVDDVMFQSHIVGGLGYYTNEVIEYLLSKQTKKRWVLGECDFNRQFEYGWESENLLNALLSVANRFVSKYKWTYNFTSSPWIVNLIEINENDNPDLYIRAARNLIMADSQRVNIDLCTRLYMLGYGEGDNQLTVESVNNGLPYIQSPQSYIDKYGIISKVLVDRRYENAESLLEYGQSLLNEFQDPPYRKIFRVADLYPLTKNDLERAEVGDKLYFDLDKSTAYITRVRQNYDIPGDLEIEISTKAGSIVESVADMADRQRIEQVYSQGATQIYSQSLQGNADKDTPLIIKFKIPQQMRIINNIDVAISLEPFRADVKVTQGGGGTSTTSSSGGGGTSTSQSGGGASSYTSSGAGGGSTQTSSSAGQAQVTSESGGYQTITNISFTGNTAGRSSVATDSAYALYNQRTSTVSGPGMHDHSIPNVTHNHSDSHYHAMAHYHNITINAHTHLVTTPNHYHNVSVPDHTHTVSVDIPAHTHSLTLSDHTHSLTIPAHIHQLEYGIFRQGYPESAKVLINGVEKFEMERDGEFELTQYLLTGQGIVPRGSWISLGVLPNDYAYVTIDLSIQGFVQSRGGGTY